MRSRRNGSKILGNHIKQEPKEVMEKQTDSKKINDKIQAMKKLAMELQDQADQFPALFRNTARILASLKMLELNISDMVDL